MYSLSCCRTCLKDTNLFPIFKSSNNNDECSNVIYAATGLKIVINDDLPQLMCTSCIRFINISSKFRKKCQLVNEKLSGKMQQNILNIKSQENCKTEIDSKILLDISDVHSNYDYEDDICLEILRYNTNDNTIEVNKELEPDKEFEKVLNPDQNHEFKMTRNKKIASYKNIKSKRRKTKTENEERKKEKNKSAKEEIECEYCHKILTSRLSLRNHYKIHTGFDVVCEHCGKKFITRRLLLMHCRAKHGYEKTDKCSYCDYRGSNAEQVKIHERLHTGEKPYVCKHCDAGFHRNSTYQQHLAIHLPEKNIQCDQCPARFKSVTLMRIHKNRHRPSLYTFICLICDNSFTRRRNAVRHLCKTHGNSEMENIKRVKKTGSILSDRGAMIDGDIA